MKEQVSKLIQMGVIPCDSELSNEKFKEYDELLIFDETLSIDEAEAIVVLFSKDCDDLNWGLLHAVESAYSENEIEKYEMLIEKCNNEEFRDILKKRLDNAKN